MKKVRVEDAVGLTLAHDVTEIVPGKTKDAAFRRGRIIETADIDRLLDLGKGHIYVTDGQEKEVHEDEASKRMASSTTDEYMEIRPAKEGKTNISQQSGRARGSRQPASGRDEQDRARALHVGARQLPRSGR